MTTLYKRDHRGNLRFWSITDEGGGELTIEFGQVGGETQVQTEYVEENTVRDIEEQTESRIRSRINKKLDKGYVYDQELAKKKADRNILGFRKPMLAAKFSNIREDIDYDSSYFQYKYDGHRCLITNDGGSLIAYTRNGKLIDTIDHILTGLKIPEGETIDGELYAHGAKLQSISSWVKRYQENTLKLRYHCYDVVSDGNYSDRLDMLKSFQMGPCAEIVPTFSYNNSVKIMLVDSISKGYEGLIIRPDGFGYEDGKRSKGLIKVKQFLDDEFRVVSISESKDNWAILNCAMENGTQFSVSAPGTIGFKTYIKDHPNEFIGKYVKVEYSGLTAAGKPFHPVAIMFRDARAE